MLKIYEIVLENTVTCRVFVGVWYFVYCAKHLREEKAKMKWKRTEMNSDSFGRFSREREKSIKMVWGCFCSIIFWSIFPVVDFLDLNLRSEYELCLFPYFSSDYKWRTNRGFARISTQGYFISFFFQSRLTDFSLTFLLLWFLCSILFPTTVCN